VAEAARAAGQQGLQFPGKTAVQYEAAYSLRTQQAFVTGKSERVDVHFPHINIKDAGCLGGIKDKQQAVLLAEAAYLLNRKYGAADISRMCHDDRAGI
jgi:hypothetical protein